MRMLRSGKGSTLPIDSSFDISRLTWMEVGRSRGTNPYSRGILLLNMVVCHRTVSLKSPSIGIEGEKLLTNEWADE